MSPLEIITQKKAEIAKLGEPTDFPHELVRGFTQIADAVASGTDLKVMGSQYSNRQSLGFWKYQYQADGGKLVIALHYSWDRCKTHSIQPDGNMLIFYADDVAETAHVGWFDEK